MNRARFLANLPRRTLHRHTPLFVQLVDGNTCSLSQLNYSAALWEARGSFSDAKIIYVSSSSFAPRMTFDNDIDFAVEIHLVQLKSHVQIPPNKTVTFHSHGGFLAPGASVRTIQLNEIDSPDFRARTIPPREGEQISIFVEDSRKQRDLKYHNSTPFHITLHFVERERTERFNMKDDETHCRLSRYAAC